MNVVILAAGMGKRMQSALPKVLHPLAGKPLLSHVLDTARSLSASRLCVIYGHGGAAVQELLARQAEKVATALQEPQLGTGHAVMQALPELAGLATSLEPDQIDNLEKKFASNLDDFRKKNMKGDKEAQQKFRYKKSMEQFELWFGNFSKAQEEEIRKASDARPLDNEIWLNERKRRQNAILTLVRKVQQEKLSKEATIPLINTLIKDSFNRLDNSEHKQFFEASEQGSLQLILTVVKIATPEQKAHAQKRMQGWIDDFRSLAAEAR